MKQFSKEELIEIKENIMNGRSITSEANRLEIDRKILKKYILNVLDEEEQEKFNTKLSSNLRKNRISVRRQKRISAEERYKNAVEELVKKE